MTRLLAITQAYDDPATRYRIGLHVSELLHHGVITTVEPWPINDDKARRRLIDRARAFDIVVVQRRLIPVGLVRPLRQAARRLIFDFDDTVTHRDSSFGPAWPLLDKVWQFRALISVCDAVTAGNEHLADLARKISNRPEIVVIPTLVDLDRYPLRPPAAPLQPVHRLAWIGQRSTLKYLEAIGRPLSIIGQRHADLCLVCISDAAPNLPDITVERMTWSAKTEAADLQGCDVGLAPLKDDAWTRGKCGLRLLQCLAAGLPTIAAPVGMQRRLIAAGAALGASTMNEWLDAITALIVQPKLRQSLAQAGRRHVELNYDVAVWTDTVLRVWTGQSTLQRQAA